MKQPLLGKRILELRTNLGYTQEELVERCNISVRTLQRIEAGDVSPRSYTIKALLDAMDCDLDDLRLQEKLEEKVKTATGFTLDESQDSSVVFQALRIGAIGGIAYLPCLAFQIMEDASYYLGDGLEFGITPTIVVSVLAMIALLFHFRAFVVLGNVFKSTFLKYAGMAAIVGAALSEIISSIDIVTDAFGAVALGLMDSLIYGSVYLVFGLALSRINRISGLVSVTRVLFIIAGVAMLSVILSLIALPLFFVLYVLTSIILFKAIEYLKERNSDTGATE